EARSGGWLSVAPRPGSQPALSPFPLLCVAADQGQSQLSNLLEQAFEAAMFVDPSPNLLREIDRNIDRARLAAHVVGQLMAMVLLARSAVAARLAAAALERNQTGGQHRFASRHLLDPAFEHPANIGGMAGNAHGDLGASQLPS